MLPFHCEPKIYLRFFKSAPTTRYKILDSRLPSCNATSEGKPPLSNSSSEAGVLPLEVCIENELDRRFSKSKFFKVHLETTFLQLSCNPVYFEPKISDIIIM